MSRRTTLRLAPVLLVTALCSAPSLARAQGHLHWPGGAVVAVASGDLVPRFANLGEPWFGPQGPALEALRQLESLRTRNAAPPAAIDAARVVALRLLARFDELERVLARLGPDATRSDEPELLLTRAYVAARHAQWPAAVTLLRRAMPLLSGTQSGAFTRRDNLLLEGARWSMARGREGLDDALALAREAVFPTPALPGATRSEGSPHARALLALVLWRAGHADEAREVARGGELPNAPAGPAPRYTGELLPEETRASILVALTLAERGYEVVPSLEELAASAPAAWRESTQQVLALARRARAPSGSAAVAPAPRPVPAALRGWIAPE